MKVSELRAMLVEMEALGHGDKEVHFSYNYGDHWRTTVAPSVDGCHITKVTYSNYHQMDKVLFPADEEDEAVDNAAREVLVLS